MGVNGVGVVALQGCGEALDAVVVCSSLLAWCRERGSELLEELECGVAKTAVCFEDYWRDGVWVVLVALVELG